MEINIEQIQDQQLSVNRCIANIEAANLAYNGIVKNRLLYPSESLYKSDLEKYYRYVQMTNQTLISQLKVNYMQNQHLINS